MIWHWASGRIRGPVGLLPACVSARLPAVRRPWEPSRTVSVVVSFVVVRLGSVTATDSLVEHEADADNRA